MIRVNEEMRGDVRIYYNSKLRRVPKKELKEKFDKLKFENKEMQKEMQYISYNLQFIEYLAIGDNKAKCLDVYFTVISFGSKKAEVTIEGNYILYNFLRKLMQSGK